MGLKRAGKKSVRNGSFFNVANVKVYKILQVVVCWLLRYPLNVIIRETELSKGTVRSIITDLRMMLRAWLSERKEKIGGPGKTVEIDESAFGKRKYNRGRKMKTRWVVGGVDRETKKCFFVVVNNRDANTLHNVIREHVLPGTHIITDCWKGYCGVDRIYYTHSTVNHSKHFINPSDRNIHTQGIESQWAKLKRDMRRRIGRMAVSRTDDYLVEYIWRSMHGSVEELFVDFTRALFCFYPH